MSDGKPLLQVLNGSRRSQVSPVAMSLDVYERKRLDIPLSAVTRIEAVATQTFSDGCGPVTYDLPHVLICLTPNMQKRLRDFTSDLVGEAIELVVGGKCLTRPVLREPLGEQSSFQISANDFVEAQALAETLRTGWRPVRAVE